jgi:bifunctional non-homologous end joining protein LigD
MMPGSAPSSLGFIKPEIPTLVPESPSGEGWIHEIKHDGYRTLIIIDQGRVRAFSRHGRDWTGPYRRVVDACAKLPCKGAVIDGEIIVQDENGISDFDALRSAIHKAPHRLVFFAFDLLHLDGQDLTRTPLMERRVALRKLIKPDPRSPLQFSDHIDGAVARFFRTAAELGLEGIVSKRAASRYRSGPSRSWLKTKNTRLPLGNHFAQPIGPKRIGALPIRTVLHFKLKLPGTGRKGKSLPYLAGMSTESIKVLYQGSRYIGVALGMMRNDFVPKML